MIYLGTSNFKNEWGIILNNFSHIILFVLTNLNIFM